LRRLERDGPVELSLFREFAPELVGDLLHQVFELEMRSWKQGRGGAVLSTPGMFGFYLRQARQLAAWGSLCVALLQHGGQPIAFELGWLAKGVYHSYKVGYDDAYRSFGPGHLLRAALMRRFHEQSDCRWVDFQGPINDALAAWSTQSYRIGRLVIARRGLRSRVSWASYRSLALLARRFRRQPTGEA
jgi:CelD/BcsL family acetyltransferase involved in cellulose biosynthesis